MSNYLYPAQPDPYAAQPYPGMPGQPGFQRPQPSGNGGYACRPVTSREEAVASQVDFLGPGSIMPDFGHGMIYFKRFNPNSGSAEFYDFAIQQAPQAAPQPSGPVQQGYDPRGDIEALRGDLNALRGELDELKKTGPKRTGGKAAEG